MASFALHGCGLSGAEAAETPTTRTAQIQPQTEIRHKVRSDASSLSPDAYDQFAAVVFRHQAMNARVTRISRALRVANAPLCAETRLDAGIATHRLDDYPSGIRPLALHFMDLGETGLYVRNVVPGSPADKAGIRTGERIVGGWPVREQAAPVRDVVMDVVMDAGHGARPIRIAPERACVAPTYVIEAQEPNAGTDGRNIELSSALVETVGDDAGLAFVIAHEMSHVLRQHAARLSDTTDASSPNLRWEAELEADRDALVLMRNAGFDIGATVASWEAGLEAHRHSQSISATHPPLDIRLRNLERTLAQLQDRPAGFLPLDD